MSAQEYAELARLGSATVYEGGGRRGLIDVPVVVGGATVRPGDVVVLDADGGAVVERERVAEALQGALVREEAERVKREKLQGGALSYDLDGLRTIVEGT